MRRSLGSTQGISDAAYDDLIYETDKYITQRPLYDDGRFDTTDYGDDEYISKVDRYTTIPARFDPNREDDHKEPYIPRPKSIFESFVGPGFFQYNFVSWFVWLPYVLLMLAINLIMLPVVVIVAAWNFFWRNLHWIILFLVVLFLAFSATYYYRDAISSAEHAFRCRIKPHWILYYRDLIASLTSAYEDTVCWWNAMVGINRVITGPPIVRMLSNCANGFTIYEWITLTVRTIVGFLKALLVWLFVEQPLDVSVAAYEPFLNLYTVWIPKTNDGVVCACESARFVTLWFTRVTNTPYLACISNHLANFSVGLVQVPTNFFLDTLRLIFNFRRDGATATQVSETLKNSSSTGGSTLPTLSKAELKERLGASAVYGGLFLNRAFTVSYCHFKSEIDAMGENSVADQMYDVCMTDSANYYDLFSSLGPIVASYLRLMSLSAKFLVNTPTILMEFLSKPPGKRYIIDVFWDVEIDYFLDTLRPPPRIQNFASSVNYPTPAIPASGTTNPPKSSILFNNITGPELYGVISNGTCFATDLDRKQVPCAECGFVVEQDLSTCAIKTGNELDRLLFPYIGFEVANPVLGMMVPSVLGGFVAFVRFISGLIAHLLNTDRLLLFLADQNHYENFFDALLGKPYQFGGVLNGFRTLLVNFDSRLYCAANLLGKPAKAYGEGIRMITTALCRFANTLANTPEPGIKDYLCISFSDCVDLERGLSWIRRPRTSLSYDPTYSYVPPSTAFEPAFLDCLCWVLDLEFLAVFTDNPPTNFPEFCCFFHYYARWLVEDFLIIVEFWLTILETAITVLDDNATIRFSVVEWAACVDYYRCTNFGAILSDVEDMLNCGCVFVIWLNDWISLNTNEFPCLCDFLSATVQWWTNAQRSSLEFTSCFYDILYCLTNSWPSPHCTTNLHGRFKYAFIHLDASFNAMSGIWGSIGCVVGLPWVGLKVDCLGTRYTWPHDHSTCNTSSHGVGVCTMADRLRMVVQYVHQMFLTLFKFFYKRVQTVIDVGFAIIAPSSLSENSISLAVMNFFLEIRDPLFGRSNKLLNEGFDTSTTGPWPRYDGINMTKLNALISQYQNVTNISGVNYVDPPSATVYKYTFNYTTTIGMLETTGLLQAAGLTLSCLLGPPTTSCVGPNLRAASTIEFTGGCLGDPAGAIATGIRDVFTMIIKFIGLGLNVIETLFMNIDQFGEALRLWINSFFQLLIVLLESIERLIQALIMVIVEVARFVFGDGVAEMFKFFLEFISKVISLFAWVIKGLLFPFGGGKRANGQEFETILKTSNQTIFENYDDVMVTMKNDAFGLSKRLADAYAKGYETVWVKRTADATTTKRSKEEEEEEDGYIRLWKRLNFEYFTKEMARNMTADTYCRKALLELTPEDGNMNFNEMSLHYEAIWKFCFFLYSLPNELFAYSGGKLTMDADTFYNLEKLESFAMNSLSMFGDYMEWNAQSGKFVNSVPNAEFLNPVTSSDVGGGVALNYTETVSVPEAILEIIGTQLEYRRSAISADLLQRYTITAGKTPVSSIKKRFDVYDVVEDGVVDWSELGKMACVPYVKQGVSGCWDLDMFEPGFTITFGENVDREWFGPTNVGLNYDPGQEFIYQLFNNTKATIYTNLNGFAYMYVESTNTTYPVVNGKISFQITNTTLYEYSQRKYPTDSFQAYMAENAAKKTQEKSVNDYLIMLHNLKGNSTPTSESPNKINVTEIIDFYKNAVYGSRNETAPEVDELGNVIKKRFYNKVTSVSKDFSNIIKSYINSDFANNDAKRKEAYTRYYGDLNEKIRNMPPDDFVKTFFNKIDGEIDEDETRYDTRDDNIMWIDALVDEHEAILGPTNKTRWMALRSHNDESNVSDYVFESEDVSLSARTYYAATRHSLIKASYEKTEKERKTGSPSFDWRLYFSKTVPAAFKHWTASSFTGKVTFDKKSERKNVLKVTHSLGEAWRIHTGQDDDGFVCGNELNDETKIRKMHKRNDLEERFVVTMDYPLDIQSDDLNEHTVDVSKPYQKLYKFLYLEPKIDRYAHRDKKLKHYDPNAGLHAHLDRFGPFDRYLMHPDLANDEHHLLSVVKLGFDSYEYSSSHLSAGSDCYDGFTWKDTMITFKRSGVIYSDPSKDKDPYFETSHPAMYFDLGHSKVACGDRDVDHAIVEEKLKDGIMQLSERDQRENNRNPKNRIEMYFSSYSDDSLSLSHYIPQNVTLRKDERNGVVGMIVRYAIFKKEDTQRFVEVVYDALTFDVERCFVTNRETTKEKRTQNVKEESKKQTFYSFFSDILFTRLNKTSTMFYNKTSEIISYVQSKHMETYAAGKVPSIDKFILTTTSWSISNMFSGMGYDGDKKESEYASFSQSYLNWSGYFDTFNIDLDTNGKRSHQPKLIKFCLPQAVGTPEVTTCGNCRSCETEYCSLCASCGNCTIQFGGYYDCEFCSNCRVNGPFCQGRCSQCTDCVTEQPCLDCRLIEYFLTKMIYYVNYCVETVLNGNDAIILRVLPNVTIIDTKPYTEDFPKWPGFGVFEILYYLVSIFTHFLNKLFGVYVFDALAGFVTSLNFDPYVENWGLLFVLWDFFIAPCNWDIHLQCTFGLGLKSGIQWSTGIVFVCNYVAWFFNPNVAGLFGASSNLFSRGSVVTFWLGLTAYLSWYIKPRCFISGVTITITNLLGFGEIIPSMYLPICAMTQINDLLKDIFNTDWTLPWSIVINNVTDTTPCNVYAVVTDCTKYGYGSGFSVETFFVAIGYIGQRFIPEPYDFWLVDYLNRTALGYNAYISNSTGPLSPFYAVDFSKTVPANEWGNADFCFYVNLPITLLVLVFLGMVLYALYYLVTLFWVKVVQNPLIFMLQFPGFASLLTYDTTPGKGAKPVSPSLRPSSRNMNTTAGNKTKTNTGVKSNTNNKKRGEPKQSSDKDTKSKKQTPKNKPVKETKEKKKIEKLNNKTSSKSESTKKTSLGKQTKLSNIKKPKMQIQKK